MEIFASWFCIRIFSTDWFWNGFLGPKRGWPMIFVEKNIWNRQSLLSTTPQIVERFSWNPRSICKKEVACRAGLYCQTPDPTHPRLFQPQYFCSVDRSFSFEDSMAAIPPNACSKIVGSYSTKCVFHQMLFQDDHVNERDLLREGVLSQEARLFLVFRWLRGFVVGFQQVARRLMQIIDPEHPEPGLGCSGSGGWAVGLH